MGIGQQIINGTYGGHETPPKTAEEEFLEWCVKHVPIGTYQVVPVSNSYMETVYLDVGSYEMPYICFTPSGAYCCSGVLTSDDMTEHLRDLEATERERGTISCEK